MLAGTHAIENVVHRPAIAAVQAHVFVHRAVHFDDGVWRVACFLVQTVDVLRDQRVQSSGAFERRQRAMAGIRLRMECRMHETLLPCEPADLGIRHVAMDVGKLFGLWILRPDALRTAKIRNAGFGGDAGTRERDDSL